MITETQRKFIEQTLPALGFTWFLEKGQYIRCREHEGPRSAYCHGKNHCPLSAAGHEIDPEIEHCEVDNSALALGIPPQEAFEIADAADKSYLHEPSIRALLLSTLGLTDGKWDR